MQSDSHGFGPGKQSWDFVEVRPGAHMFYWLYYTTASDEDYSERPLIIWLQGGPGGSSTGYGNFAEIGPLHVDLRVFQVNRFNVLFIDNPVGAGFSYVEEPVLFAKNNAEIAGDLVHFMMEFYQVHPEFSKSPLHVFSQSYGGKMAAEFALNLDRAIKEGRIDCDLRSVALGAPWISPEDSGHFVIQSTAEDIQDLIRSNQHRRATEVWRSLESIILNETFGIDCYNVLLPQKFGGVEKRSVGDDDREVLIIGETSHYHLNPPQTKLERLMRGTVSETLQIPAHVRWGSQREQVFEAIAEDFMKPATSTVELLLNSTDLDVIVYTGQLDLVVCTPGTVRWVENLRWPGREDYLAAPRVGMGSLGILEGYEKRFDRLSMYWINRAGHMAPIDNPNAMQYILDKHVGA
ncbi:hypothetical protein pipiens_019414 [Culex pipiens pipiens]|uniref:Retinoid-inducible serine carboxypeptidase n=1 Tax=Culex pipiens pipiens TaxID=38569 RepID=A0ABD1DUB2_CULPP